jgi:hypothetical protein
VHHKSQRPELKVLVDEFEQKIAKQRGPEPDKSEKVLKKGTNEKMKDQVLYIYLLFFNLFSWKSC